MSGLQELRKRLRSVQTTGQLAEAMRTAATARYARVSRVREEFTPYARACGDMLRLLGSDGVPRRSETAAPRDCLVVMSSNRGLCGGFNSELLRFLEGELAGRGTAPLLLVCGRSAAAWLRDRGLEAEEFILPDVPDYAASRLLARRIRQIYADGEAERVVLVYQSFQNMIRQTPASLQLLPETEAPSGTGDASLLYLPDRESIMTQLAESCLDARIFSLALENAAGAQAATLVAMRSASENAQRSAAELQLTINRRRQAEVTSGVIETSSGSFQ